MTGLDATGKRCNLVWDAEAGAGYLYLTSSREGEAVHQRIVENPVEGIGDVVLDFNEAGELLGIEFLDEQALPSRWKS